MEPTKTFKDGLTPNISLKAPQGVSEEECGPLPVVMTPLGQDGIGTLISCWEMSDEELEIIKKTKRVFLTIAGSYHPMVKVSADVDVQDVDFMHNRVKQGMPPNNGATGQA